MSFFEFFPPLPVLAVSDFAEYSDIRWSNAWIVLIHSGALSPLFKWDQQMSQEYFSPSKFRYQRPFPGSKRTQNRAFVTMRWSLIYWSMNNQFHALATWLHLFRTIVCHLCFQVNSCQCRLTWFLGRLTWLSLCFCVTFATAVCLHRLQTRTQRVGTKQVFATSVFFLWLIRVIVRQKGNHPLF